MASSPVLPLPLFLRPRGVVQKWSTLQCSEQNTEQCGYDHAPVTRVRMRAQFPLPHGPVFALAPARLSLLPRLPRVPRPSWALSVLCGLSSVPRPFLLVRARCIAIRGAPWYPTLCRSPCGCSQASFCSGPVPLRDLPACARTVQSSVQGTSVPIPPSPSSAPASWGPLPPLSLSAPWSVLPPSLRAASLWALSMTVCKTPCTTLTFSPYRPRHLRAADALPAASTAPAGSPTASGSSDRGAPGGGCCRGTS